MSGTKPTANTNSGANTGANSGSAGSGQSHTHGVGNFAFTGTAIDMDVKFIDVIAASKD